MSYIPPVGLHTTPPGPGGTNKPLSTAATSRESIEHRPILVTTADRVHLTTVRMPGPVGHGGFPHVAHVPPNPGKKPFPAVVHVPAHPLPLSPGIFTTSPSLIPAPVDRSYQRIPEFPLKHGPTGSEDKRMYLAAERRPS